MLVAVYRFCMMGTSERFVSDQFAVALGGKDNLPEQESSESHATCAARLMCALNLQCSKVAVL